MYNWLFKSMILFSGGYYVSCSPDTVDMQDMIAESISATLHCLSMAIMPAIVIMKFVDI